VTLEKLGASQMLMTVACASDYCPGHLKYRNELFGTTLTARCFLVCYFGVV
jgi:hypothetical protein